MKTNEFLAVLKQHPTSEVLFEYQPDKFVKANYHITEIKRVTVESVDCGGGQNAWEETVVQLWVNPLEPNKKKAMTAEKAQSIFQRVLALQKFDLNTEVKIEYGNKQFNTSQLTVNNVLVYPSSLIVKLHDVQTRCKARETCCATTEVPKEKVAEVCCS